MFIIDKVEGNDCSLLEFEITGSTYDPIGGIHLHCAKVAGSDVIGFQELSTISVMCNDSSVDFTEFKNQFALMTALIVLAEKINPFNQSKFGVDWRSAALITRCNMETRWKKDFTREFSRDRKSMSTYSSLVF